MDASGLNMQLNVLQPLLHGTAHTYSTSWRCPAALSKALSWANPTALVVVWVALCMHLLTDAAVVFWHGCPDDWWRCQHQQQQGTRPVRHSICRGLHAVSVQGEGRTTTLPLNDRCDQRLIADLAGSCRSGALRDDRQSNPSLCVCVVIERGTAVCVGSSACPWLLVKQSCPWLL